MKTKVRFSGLVWLIAVFALPGIFSLGSCEDNTKDPAPPPPVDQEVGKASVLLTTGDQTKLLSRENDLSIIKAKETPLPVVTVNPDQTFQVIEGFGAALTGSSAFLINTKLNTAQRTALLQELFNPESGIGISAIRLTIGASDFSLTDFTYNDMPTGQTDYNLSNFSIDMERSDLLPVLRTINGIAPDLTIMASPWSPPAWMKTNGSLNGGSLKTEAYEVYSEYFRKYISAFSQEGIAIDAITVQNEPLHSTNNYPSMLMTAEEQRNFIKNNLGPLFQSNSIGTKILLYDHNWDVPQYPVSIMNDPVAKQYVAGSAFHAYAGDVSAMSIVHNAHPDKGLYFTEISGGQWATNFSDNLQWNMANIFIGTTKNWSKTALLWNLALDQNFGPTNGGCMDCRGVVTINPATGVVTRNVEYYAIGHFSKFVRNGAVRIASSVSTPVAQTDFVAFRNTSGRKVIVFSNAGTTARDLVVREGERQFALNLPARSVLTATWE